MGSISHAEIKEKLVHHHDPDESVDDRVLTILRVTNRVSDDNNVIFFKIDGCPPHGYGIFMEQRKLLILYTTRGRPFEEIEVDEVLE